MAKHSKKYREAAEKVDRNNLYTPDQAIALLKSMPTRNFDEAVEAVVRLNVDPRKADQLVRGTVSLPVRPLRFWCSPVARRPPPLRKPAPTSSVMMTSSPRCRVASSTSTPSSLLRT